ncbi:hypothetical protein LINPERHAP2_LOCUS3442 [Linum perenne]
MRKSNRQNQSQISKPRFINKSQSGHAKAAQQGKGNSSDIKVTMPLALSDLHASLEVNLLKRITLNRSPGSYCHA